ncbi:MAG: PAS domain S-box protein, partial [Chloroflexi bacterium]|nr:PAS domain S-box protein [Chloroflexota bacterium]
TERRKAEEALHFIRFALDNTDEAMVCVSQDARYIDVNDTFCRSVGYSREELLSMKVHDIDPSYSAQIWSDFWRELKKKGSLTFESCHRKKDGKVFPVEIMVTFFEYKGKEYHCGFARDITERKRAEQLLKESEARFATIFRANPAAIAVTRLSDARLINVNEAWQRVTGYSSTEVIGHTIPELNLWVNPGQRDRIVEMVQKQGRVHDEMQLRHKSGEIRELLMSAELTELNGQNYLLMMAQDITEKKRVEEELKQSEAKFRSVLDSSVDMIYRANLKTGTYDYVSPAAEKIIGYTPEELMALGLMGGRSLAHPDDLERLDQNVIDLVLHGGNGEMPSAVEYRFKHKKLGYRWDVRYCSIVCDGTGEPVAVVGVLRDITERKQLEETLRESEGKYRALVEAAGRVGEGIIIVQDREDGEGIIVFVNDEFCNLSGYSREELLNRTYLEFHSLFDFSQEIVERHRRRKQGEDVPTCYEVKAIRKDGTALFVEIGVSLLPWQGKTATVVYVRDITERRRIENALRASEEGYRELADSIGDVFFAMDGNLRYTYWNRASEELTGIKAIDAIGKSVNEILGDTEQTLRAVEIYRKVLVTQQSQSFINEHNIAGKQYFSEIHAYPSRDGLSVFVKDITRRKQAEEALR